MKKLRIIKIGGNVIDDAGQLKKFLKTFSAIKGPKILVHGGGKIATQLGSRMGIKSKMIEGRRITDRSTLELVQMVYGGLLNKNIVALLQGMKCNALGITGADGNSIKAKKRPVKKIDYGFVGDVTSINAVFFNDLIIKNIVPVIAALTHDGKGGMLNTNADTLASELAAALSKKYKVELVYCFEKAGVLRDVHNPSSVISEINTGVYSKLKANGIIADGMIPKMDNAFMAIKRGVNTVIIMHAENLNRSGKSSFNGTRLVK